MRRAAVFAALLCGTIAAAWFFPMRGTNAFVGETPLRFAVHVAILCFVTAGTGAVFGWVAAILTLRFGIPKVAAVAAVLCVLSSVYPAWRQQGPLSALVWLEGLLWAFGFAAFVAGTGAIVRSAPSGGADASPEKGPRREE